MLVAAAVLGVVLVAAVEGSGLGAGGPEVLTGKASSMPSPSPSPTVQFNERAYRAGDCVTWAAGAVGSVADLDVPCSSPCRTQITGSTVYRAVQYPSDAEWATFDSTGACQADDVAFLGEPINPSGQLDRGSIGPRRKAGRSGTESCGAASRRHWAAGRSTRCSPGIPGG